MLRLIRFNILIFIGLLLSIPVLSQVKKVEITGIVVDKKSRKAIKDATISILSSVDSTFIKWKHSKKNGAFSILISPKERRILEISCIGYEKQYITLPPIKGKQQLQLGEIGLSLLHKKLKTVTITSKKKLYLFKKDSTIFNVPQGFATGGSARDVLAFTPLVTIDFNNNIRVKGQTGVSIYIDNQPISELGISVNDYLQNTPAFMIKRIEILKSPPDPGDAAIASISGVTNHFYINILTRKIRYRGYRAGITTGLNTRGEQTGRMNFNMNLKPFSLSYSNNIQKSTDSSYRDRISFLENNDSTTLHQNNYRERSFFNQNLNAQYTFHFTQKEKLRVQTRLDWHNQNAEGRNKSLIYTPKNLNDQYRIRNNSSQTDRYGLSTSINYKKDYEKTGKELSISANLQHHQTNGIHQSLGAYRIKNDTLYQLNKGDNKNQNIQTNIQYKNTFGASNNYFYLLNGALSWSHRHDRNDVSRSDSSLTTSDLFKNERLSTNTFNNNKNFSSLLLVGKHDNKLEWLSGAAILYRSRESHDNYRQSNVNNHRLSVITGITVNYRPSDNQKISLYLSPKIQKYDQVFKANDSAQTITYKQTSFIPDASLKYDIGNHQIAFQYKRINSQPSWRQLNPYINNKDPLNILTGNPYLRPENSNNYQIQYKYNYRSVYASLELEDDISKDIITPYTSIDSNGVSTRTFINLKQEKRRSASLNAGIHYYKNISEWNTRININAEGAISAFQKISLDPHVSKEFRNVSGYTGSFKIWAAINYKFLALIMNGNYTGPHYFSQGRRPSQFRSGLKMRADLIKNKLSLTFGVENMFGASVRDNFYQTDQYIEYSSDRKHVRYFSLYVSYNFKRNKKLNNEEQN